MNLLLGIWYWKSVSVKNTNDETKRQVWGLCPWKEGLFMAGPAYLTFCIPKVSLVNSSMSAAVPTNRRRSSESWSRVIVPPIGRSHLPIISSNKNVWWSPRVQVFSHTLDKLFTKTLACLKKCHTDKRMMSHHLGDRHLLHHGFSVKSYFLWKVIFRWFFTY